MTNPSVSATYTDSRGDFTYVITEQLGRCGTCRAWTAVFISRNGTTQCVECDIENSRSPVGSGERRQGSLGWESSAPLST
jgi:hypothetical protein